MVYILSAYIFVNINIGNIRIVCRGAPVEVFPNTARPTTQSETQFQSSIEAGFILDLIPIESNLTLLGPSEEEIFTLKRIWLQDNLQIEKNFKWLVTHLWKT